MNLSLRIVLVYTCPIQGRGGGENMTKGILNVIPKAMLNFFQISFASS